MRVVKTFDEVKYRKRGLPLILEAMLDEQFALERSVEAFAHRVVVAITNGAHRRPYAGFGAALPERNRGILAALVGMMNDIRWFAPVERHVERIEHEFGS